MSKLISCKSCGTEIAKNAETCPKCGEPNKEKTSWLTIGLGVIFLIYLATSGGDPEPSIGPASAQSAYTGAAGLDYRAATLDQLLSGTMMAFNGKVTQLVGENRAMIATGQSRFGYSGDLIYTTFSSAREVIEGDELRIQGRYNGTMTYKTVLRRENTVPHIMIDYYSISNKAK